MSLSLTLFRRMNREKEIPGPCAAATSAIGARMLEGRLLSLNDRWMRSWFGRLSPFSFSLTRSFHTPYTYTFTHFISFFFPETLRALDWQNINKTILYVCTRIKSVNREGHSFSQTGHVWRQDIFSFLLLLLRHQISGFRIPRERNTMPYDPHLAGRPLNNHCLLLLVLLLLLLLISRHNFMASGSRCASSWEDRVTDRCVCWWEQREPSEHGQSVCDHSFPASISKEK